MMGSLWLHSQMIDEDQGSGGDHGESHDEVGFEPIVALAFVEDDLQSAQAERDEAEADVVDVWFR